MMLKEDFRAMKAMSRSAKDMQASSRLPAQSKDRSMMLKVTTSAFFSAFSFWKSSRAVSPAASPPLIRCYMDL